MATALDAPVKPTSYVAPTATASDDSAASDIVAGGQPNVGLFAWTTNDLTGIKDIVTYVKASLAAATRAEAAAVQAELTKGHVEELSNQYEAIVSQIDNQYIEIVKLANTINVDVNQISQYVNTAGDIQVAVQQQYDQISSWREDIIKYTMLAVYKYNERESSSQTATVYTSDGSVQKLKLNSSSTTISLVNPTDDSNICRQITLMLHQGTGSNIVVWPSNVKWNNGRTPVLSYEKDKMDIITLLTKDSGASWYGFYNGGWFNA